MTTYGICTEAAWGISGAAALVAVSTLLTITKGTPMANVVLPYQEIIGADLNNVPVEAGFPHVKDGWHFDFLPRADAAALMALCPNASAVVYISTRRETDFAFANYKARLLRPTFDMVMGGVANFVMLLQDLELQT